MKTILLKISNTKIAFNPKDSVSLSMTNIPTEAMRFRDSKPIFWEVEMISMVKQDGRLKVKVVDYIPKDISRFSDQEPKYQIQEIEFMPLHWTELQSFLSTYQLKFLQDFITKKPFNRVDLKTFKIPLKVSLKKLKFELGFVSFNKKFKWKKDEEVFRIAMPDSIPEYDYIKSYFIKILGKSTIDVVIEVVSSNTETKVKSVNSIDLNKLNDGSIQILKVQKLQQWSSKKPKFAPPDQDIFTFEEAMKSFGDEALGNLDVLEKDLLLHLLDDKEIRNKMQLQYLSERIHDLNEKLLMTLVPQFGFVFVHEGEEMTHYIWELLNSHATYVWSMTKMEPKGMIKIIEQEIRTINLQGRTAYKSHFRPSNELFFQSITHRSSQYSYEQYFSRWKKNLDNLLF